LKNKFPHNIYLLRGNHESEIGKFYPISLYNDLYYLFRASYDEKYEQFLCCFAKLPIIAIIDDVYFCSHGGIPRPSDGISFDKCYETLKKTKLPFITNFTLYNNKTNLSYDEQLIAKLIYGIIWCDPADFQECIETYYDGCGSLWSVCSDAPQMPASLVGGYDACIISSNNG